MDQDNVITRREWVWDDLRTVGIGLTKEAGDVPMWIRRLLLAKSEDECEEALLHMRGDVVRQGSVYESAEGFVDYCLAVLEGMDESEWGCGVGDALDVIVEIIEGEADPTEVECGNGDVVEKCQELVQEYAPLMYRLAESTDEYTVFGAVEILSVVFPGDEKLLSLVKWVSTRELRMKSQAIHGGLLQLLDWVGAGNKW